MTVTQYIGARYVPVFADPAEWNDTRTYEPLTIVMHEGNSYTSKQYVPAGIDIENDKFWAETGNYNAQVEAYRQEVANYADNVNEIKNDLSNFITNTNNRFDLNENDIDIYSPYLQGTSVLISHNDVNILLDTGDNSDYARLNEFLFNKLGINKLNAVVLTHFDHDHSGAFNAAVNYCDTNTDIFIQMRPTENNGGYNTYINVLATINELIQTNGLKSAVVPDEGAIYNYNDVKLTINNTTLENRTLYDSMPGESSAWNVKTSTLNNYSLITTIDINGYKIVYSGDIEAAAQRVNTKYMQKCQLAFTPHHISAVGGYLNYYQTLSPEKWLGTTAASTFKGSLYVITRYIVKLINYNYIDDVILTHNKPLHVNVKNGNYKIVSGESLIGIIGIENLANYYTSYYQILPPTYINDNPKALYNMTLKELITESYYTKAGAYTLSSNMFNTDDLLKELQIYQDICALITGSYDVSTTLIEGASITFNPGRFMDITFHRTPLTISGLIVYSTYNIETQSGFSKKYYTNAYKLYVEEGFIANNYNVNDIDSNFVAIACRSKIISIVTTTGLTMHMFRNDASNSKNYVLGASSLTGTATDSNMNYIYRANLATNGNLTLSRKSLSNPETELNYLNVRSITIIE